MTGLSSLNASGGLAAALRAFDRSASATTQAGNELADPTASGSDLVDAVVGMRIAASAVKANVAVVHTADEMLGTLLDMHA